MAMKDLTPAGLVEIIDEIVDEKGADYVYAAPEEARGLCVYTAPDGTPSCIVGRVIARVEPELLEHINSKEWGERDDGSLLPNEMTVFNLAGDGILNFNDRNLLWMLSEAQHMQDGGKSYGTVAHDIRVKAGLN